MAVVFEEPCCFERLESQWLLDAIMHVINSSLNLINNCRSHQWAALSQILHSTSGIVWSAAGDILPLLMLHILFLCHILAVIFVSLW